MSKELLIALLLALLPLSASAQEASPTHAVGGDFTGDGLVDLAVASSAGRVFLLTGLAGGEFSPIQTFLVPGNPDTLLVAEINGDDKLDVICPGGNGIHVLYGQTSGLSQPVALLSELPSVADVATGDYNNDGVIDLAVVTRGPNALTLYLGDGHGAFPDTLTTELVGAPFSVVSLDFDQDGTSEVAVSLVSHSHVVWGRAENQAIVTQDIQFEGPVGHLATGDFDSDGREDLAAISNNTFWVLTRRHGTNEAPWEYRVCKKTAKPHFLTAGDIDGDGEDELVSTDLNTGSIIFPSGELLDAGVNTWRTSTVDLDKDGQDEILASNALHGTVTVIWSAEKSPRRVVYTVDPNKK